MRGLRPVRSASSSESGSIIGAWVPLDPFGPFLPDSRLTLYECRFGSVVLLHVVLAAAAPNLELGLPVGGLEVGEYVHDQ